MAYTQYFKQSPNYTPASQTKQVWGVNRQIKYICIHWWDRPENKPSFNGVVSLLLSSSRQASAHYVAEAGRVAQLVKEEDNAWANGSGNPYTISIECNPRASTADRQTIAELVAKIRKRRGNLPLVPHSKFQPTQCPGVYNKYLSSISEAANKINNPPAPTPITTPKWVAMSTPRKLRTKENLYVVDLVTGKNQGDVLRAGTDIEFSTKTTWKNQLWLRSKYATGRKLNWGIPFSKLAELQPAEAKAPAPPPPVKTDTTQPSAAGTDRIGELEKRVGVIEQFINWLKTIFNFK